ncbi:MAG: hypothetical protein ABIV36_06730 [Sphingobium limneticum]
MRQTLIAGLVHKSENIPSLLYAIATFDKGARSGILPYDVMIHILDDTRIRIAVNPFAKQRGHIISRRRCRKKRLRHIPPTLLHAVQCNPRRIFAG